MPFRDPLERKSKVSQKLCWDKLCEVAVLKELVDDEHYKEISQKPHMCPFGADSLKRIFQVSFTKLYYEKGCM